VLIVGILFIVRAKNSGGKNKIKKKREKVSAKK
jgi:hypothetical protein